MCQELSVFFLQSMESPGLEKSIEKVFDLSKTHSDSQLPPLL